MDRTRIVVGSCIAVLAAAGIGELYLDKKARTETPPPVERAPSLEAPKAPETQPVSAGEVIASFLSAAEGGSESSRLISLGALLDELEGPEYAKAAISSEAGESLAKAGIEAVSGSGPESMESSKLNERLVGLLASRTHGETSRDYILKILEEGPPELRQAALGHIGGPHGVGGRAVFEKVQELGEKGLIAGDRLPGVLRRAGGKKAVEPILSLMRSTDNWKTISACAVALQDMQDPGVMGPILERLDQTGILDHPKRMPWISSGMLSRHLETAEGSSLTRGIKVMKARPFMVKTALAAVQRGLEKGDPETRRVSAEAIKKAVLARRLDPKQAEGLLAGRLDRETEPVLKAELSGGLEQVRGFAEAPKTEETSQQ